MGCQMKKGRAKGSAAGKKTAKAKVSGAASEFFDSRAGIATAMVLALVLWWVPYLGPMAAGFMGGRKAGSMVRGAIAGAVACLGVMIIMGIMSVAVSGLLYGDISEGFHENFESLYTALSDFSAYIDSFVEVEGSSIFFDQSNYFLVIALAIIGGAFADQNRREVRATVDLTKESNQAPIPKSVRAYRDHRAMGFQTYEDYARMSVNIPAAADPREAPRRSTPAAEEQPQPAVQVQTQHTVPAVTSTVSTSSVTTTVPEQEKPKQRKPSQIEDYEFL